MPISFSPEVVEELRGKLRQHYIKIFETILAAVPDAAKRVSEGKPRQELEKHLRPLDNLIRAILAVADDLKDVPRSEQPEWRGTMDQLLEQVMTHVGTLGLPAAGSRGTT